MQDCETSNFAKVRGPRWCGRAAPWPRLGRSILVVCVYSEADNGAAEQKQSQSGKCQYTDKYTDTHSWGGDTQHPHQPRGTLQSGRKYEISYCPIIRNLQKIYLYKIYLHEILQIHITLLKEHRAHPHFPP